MRRVGLLVALVSCIAAAQEAPLKLVQTVRLPAAVKGHFDHFGVDVKGKRLFVTPEDYQAVLVLDLNTNQVIHEIRGIARPHAVLYREDVDRIFVTDGVDGALKVFDGKTYAALGSVKLLKDADSMGYDPFRQLVYIDNGGRDEGQKYSMLSVVDVAGNKKAADIKIDGDTLEAMALDVYRPRLYLNDPGKSQVVALDRWKGAAVGTWPLTMGTGNVAMGLDEPHQRLFVGCRSGHIVVFDTNTGKELQALPISKGIDDLEYDPASRRIYAATDGSVNVFEEVDADHYKALGTVPSGPVGRTARLIPQLNRYVVAVPAHDAETAAILFFEPVGAKTAKPAAAETKEPVNAPDAETLLLATMSAHPYLRKMGLHGVPPGGKISVIVANANAGRIGVPTTEGDFAAVKDGKTYCAKKDDGAYYNIKMPMFDASHRPAGILVMEIPYSSAKDEAESVKMAESLREEVAAKIPSWAQLFKSR